MGIGGQDRRSTSAEMRRWAALASLLVVTLVTAPLPRALRAECELCPPNCPMHRDHGDAEARADTAHAEAAPPAHMKCHGGGMSATRDDAPAPHTASGPRLARPACGTHATVAAPALPPMILPPALPASGIAAIGLPPAAADASHDRGAEPPDTPPPIVLA